MTTTSKELYEHCGSIKEELYRVFDGEAINDETGEPLTMWDYFDDALDIVYMISGNGDFLGCRIAVALGGPNIWIDTYRGEIAGAWGCDRESVWIPAEICDEISAVFEELYNCTR